MKRDITGLTGEFFDVLIIGGGIHGAAIARECSRHGLKTALVEQGDFGHATSANSLKIMHGGLRYLQHLNFKRMRDSIQARREMLQIAPHYVKPLGCVIPNAGFGVRGNLFMRCALWLNDLIGFDRNSGLPAVSQLPPGKILSRRQYKEIVSGPVADGSSGASLWYDALAVNSERLTLSLVQAAVASGAQVANYTRLKKVHFARGEVTGGLICDLLDGSEYTVQARTVVNAGGPWIDLVQQETAAACSDWAKAVNIIVKKTFFGPYAVGLTGGGDFKDKDSFIRKKGRLFFFVPWRGYTMIGTTYKPFGEAPDNLRAEAGDIDELIAEVNTIYPAASLTRDDVTRSHVGLVPMAQVLAGAEDDVQLVKESEVIDHGKADPAQKGFYSVRGVKYTTALRVAEEVGNMIRRSLNSPDKADRPFPLSSAVETEKNESSLLDTFHFLVERYGPLVHDVYVYVRKNEEMVSEVPPLCLGEIDYFLAEEMACTLGDVVFRRCELASAECPPPEILECIARYMGRFHDWDEARIKKEIQNVTEVFEIR